MSSSLPGPERNIRPLPQVIPQRCTMRHIEEINRSDSSAPTSIDRDHWLVAALRRRDSTAAEHLVAAYSDRAIRLATGITGNAQDAEEVVQDAFLSVIQKIDTFRGDAAFGSWLYRIVANAAYRRCRSRRRRGDDVSLDNLLPVFDQAGRHVAPMVDWSISIDDPARQTELRMVLTTAIDQLPPNYRTVVLMRDVEGLPHRHIAEALGLTAVNVKMRVHRARLFLRKRLDEHPSIAGADGHPSDAGADALETTLSEVLA